MTDKTYPDADGGAMDAPRRIYVQYSDCGEHIRKWSREPFDGAVPYDPSPVWQPIETLLDDQWVIGKLEGKGRAPAFVGKKYELAKRASGLAVLIDEWSGKWKEVTAWMPLPAGPEEV